MSKPFKQVTLKIRYPNDQHSYEKSFNFTNHKRREMQVKDTHNEVSSHTHQGSQKKKPKHEIIRNVGKEVEKLEPL